MEIGDRVRLKVDVGTVPAETPGKIIASSTSTHQIIHQVVFYGNIRITTEVEEKYLEPADIWDDYVKRVEKLIGQAVVKVWESRSQLDCPGLAVYQLADGKYTVWSTAKSSYLSYYTLEQIEGLGWKVSMQTPPVWERESSNLGKEPTPAIEMCKYHDWQPSTFKEVLVHSVINKRGNLTRKYSNLEETAKSIEEQLVRRTKTFSLSIPYCYIADKSVNIQVKRAMVDKTTFEFTAGFHCEHCSRKEWNIKEDVNEPH